MTPPDFTAPGVTPDLATINAAADEQPLDPAAFGFGDETSDLEDLDDDLAPINVPTIKVKVPQRPKYLVECRIDFTQHDLEKVRKVAKDTTFADGINGTKFAGGLLAKTCVAILKDGRRLKLDGTSPITFASPELRKRMGGAANASECATVFYGLEGELDAASQRLMFEAGYGRLVGIEDPTE